MKSVLVAVLCLVLFPVCAMAQKTDKKKNVPDEKITVKREYDKSGNLIGFDSLRVWSWSGDTAFRFPMEGGWENFFGKDFFDNRFGFSFNNDSGVPFHPFGDFGLRFLDEDDLFKKFMEERNDSSGIRNFLFHSDSSLFMGPHSSFMLPPGFFLPDMKGMKDFQEFFEKHFKPFSPEEYPDESDGPAPYKRFINPRQQQEYERLLKKQQQELNEFNKKWNRENQSKGIEKM